MAIPSAGILAVDDSYSFGNITYTVVALRTDGSYISQVSATASGITGEEIQTAYEGLSDVNRFSDIDKQKLDAVPTSNTIVTGPANLKLSVLTQLAYDALTPDANTLYFIK